MAKKFKPKEKEVSAIQWDGSNLDEVQGLLGKGETATVTRNALLIQTKHTAITMKKTDYIVKDLDSISSMSEDDFKSKYQEDSE